jgi:hypothetical protein
VARRSWLANFVQGKKEVAMARDLLTLAALSIMFGVIVWIILGSPQKNLRQKSWLRMETSRSLNADPDLRLISERSSYMRTER